MELKEHLENIFALSAAELKRTFVPEGSKAPFDHSNLEEYQREHRRLLKSAVHYVIDWEAEKLLRKLAADIRDQELEDTISNLQLPFPVMLVETKSVVEADIGCIFEQMDVGFRTECFWADHRGCTFNFRVLKWRDRTPDVLLSPLGILIDGAAMEQIEQEIGFNKHVTNLFAAMVILLNYEGMLSSQNVSLHSRAERRRAKKDGYELPDDKKVVISLGKLGVKQQALMSGNVPANVRWPEKSEQVSYVDFPLLIRQRAGTKERRWQDDRDGTTALHSRRKSRWRL